MKRLIVFSDTHGNLREMRDALGRFTDIDTVIHLGDGLADGEAVAKEFGIPFLGVLGNEDWAADCPPERVISVGTCRVLALHGHQFDITPYDGERKLNEDLKRMAAIAALKGARVLLFGHSHRPMLGEFSGVILCNPGDQYVGSMGGASFCLLDLTADGITVSLYVKEGGGWRLSSFLDAHGGTPAP